MHGITDEEGEFNDGTPAAQHLWDFFEWVCNTCSTPYLLHISALLHNLNLIRALRVLPLVYTYVEARPMPPLGHVSCSLAQTCSPGGWLSVREISNIHGGLDLPDFFNLHYNQTQIGTGTDRMKSFASLCGRTWVWVEQVLGKELRIAQYGEFFEFFEWRRNILLNEYKYWKYLLAHGVLSLLLFKKDTSPKIQISVKRFKVSIFLCFIPFEPGASGTYISHKLLRSLKKVLVL